MAVPAANSSLSRPIEALVNTLADSATFRSLVGAVDADGAKTKIFYPAVDDSLDSSDNLINGRPRAIINPPTSWMKSRLGGDYQCVGNVWLSFEIDPIGDTFEEQAMNLCNTLGAIIDEMWDLAESRSGPYLNIVEIALADGPGPNTPENDRGESFQGAIYSIGWQ
ncbi:MAG TPA: hypothetical protein VGJ26_15415 [Pirellulales bacterium]|jgi:hypothetical protein